MSELEQEYDIFPHPNLHKGEMNMDEKIEEIKEWQKGIIPANAVTYSITIEEYWKACKYVGNLLSECDRLEPRIKELEVALSSVDEYSDYSLVDTEIPMLKGGKDDLS